MPSVSPSSTTTPEPSLASVNPAANIVSIQIEVIDRNLTFTGDSRQLKVIGLDSSNQTIVIDPQTIEWSSSRPQDVSIASTGEVKALTDIGYSEVIARLKGMTTTVLLNIFDPNVYVPSTRSSSTSTTKTATAYKPHPINEFQVNSYTGTRLQQNDVAMDEDGDFVIIWRDTNRNGIYGRCFNHTANALNEDFLIGPAPSKGAVPEIAMDTDGDFIVVWNKNDANADYGIFAKRYRRDCTPRDTSEFQVNTYTIGNQFRPSVALEDNGDFVVVWESKTPGDTPEGMIKGRRYTRGGSVAQSEFQVSVNHTARNFNQRASVAMDADGDFVVVWEDNDYGVGDGSYGATVTII